jgi:hypothetical protein
LAGERDNLIKGNQAVIEFCNGSKACLDDYFQKNSFLQRGADGNPYLDLSEGSDTFNILQKQTIKLPTGLSTSEFTKLYAGINGEALAGGVQGMQGSFVTIPYQPGSFLDKLNESMAGAHDTFSHPFYYDALGNMKEGASSGLNSAWSFINLIPAAPFGLGTLNNAIPGFVVNIILNTNQNNQNNTGANK